MNNQKPTTNNQQPTTNNKQTTNNQQQTTNLFLLFITIFWSQLGFIQVAQATNYCAIAPLEAELLVKTDRLREREIITADTISQTEITTPSLWWARDQIDPFRGRLIINWLAYQQEKRIDLIVNRQLWSLLNYLNRYSFVNQFGTVAREYEYNLRVFNQQQECLSTYTCNYAISPPRCQIQFNYDTDRL